VLILGIIGFGMLIGWLAQLLLGVDRRQVDWVQSLVAGLVGSFLGGLIFSLLAGDGLSFRPSGVIGSLLGAVIVVAIWNGVRRSRRQKEQAAALKTRRSGRHH
jgi:uncharacterized membrane protein YeaQ/YmgE (transglycosylase-associated protein family)